MRAMKGEVSVRPVHHRAWKYPDIPALKPGESVLYRWESLTDDVDHERTLRSTASRLKSRRSLLLSVHQSTEGILVVRAEEEVPPC